MLRKPAVSALSLACGAVAMTGSAAGDPATPERLLNAGSQDEAANWLMVHRSYDAHRFSPLDEITPDNVSNMDLAFAVPFGGDQPNADGKPAVQTTPLVKDGMLYIDDPWGTPKKFDLTSGTRAEHVWTCLTGIEKDPSETRIIASRGLALINDKVISTLPDGQVVACNDETGEVEWEKQVAKKQGEGFTNAPLAVGDQVLVGQSYGDWATRGWIAALDAETGEENWRFYTVPEPGQPGSNTWKCKEANNPGCWKTGGAAAWVTGSYDPDSNTTIWGTGNPVPMYDPEYRPGDNLYSDSTIALNMDDGSLEWYHQYTPGDYFDYDEVGIQLLVDDAEINGEDRDIVAHFGRNGFFDRLDQTNGSFIGANQYVSKIDWTKGIDQKTGKPVEYDPSKSLQEYAGGAVRREGPGIQHCPDVQGGVNFWPSAYNPNTGIAYGAAIEGCSESKTESVAPEDVQPGKSFFGGGDSAVGAQHGSIFGFNVDTGKQTVKVDRKYPNYSGVGLTPGLVWVGEIDGTIGAYDADTLEQLWSVNVGAPFNAPPISFAVDGKQYIAIAGGAPGNVSDLGGPELNPAGAANMLYVFSLDS